MKKLGKIKLQNAIVLDEQEMKRVLGGSYSHHCKCADGTGEWYGNYSGSGAFDAIRKYCSGSGGYCGSYG